MYTYYLKFSRDDDEDRKNWGNESEKSLIDQISGEEEILVERGRHREKCFHQFPIQPRSPQFQNDKRWGGGSDWRVVVARNPAQLGSNQVFVR